MELISYILVAILSALVYFRNYLRAVYLSMSLKGPRPLPILGNIFMIKQTESLVDLSRYCSKKYGPFTRFWFSVVPYVLIYEPKHLKIILGNNKVSKKNILYDVLHNFLGEGLITNNGFAWKKNRRLLQPYFNTNVLEKYIHFFSDKAQEMVGNLNGHKEVNVTSFINTCVLSILHRAILGEPLDEQSPYRQGEVVLLERIVKPWLMFESVFKLTGDAENEVKQKLNLHQYTKKILQQRCSQVDRVKDCLLDVLIDISKDNKEFTSNDIINETVTFMLAGQDSVAATLAFSLFYLAKYEDVQQKVLNEINTITETELTAEDLNSMKYLEQVLKETMRLAPAIPLMTRVLTEDVDLDGTIFPVGQNILYSPFITQRLPHIYPNPEVFDPDRFSSENSENIHPYAFIPFSIGPRMCLGYKYAMMEMKTILFHFLKAYHITSVKGYEELNFSYRISLRAKGGIRINLNKR